MQTRSIGKLQVSVIGLGCNNFGKRLDQTATNEVVSAALDAGISFFDTANTYGSGNGESEAQLGIALSERRDEAVIGTKFGMPMADGRWGAKPEYLTEMVEDSLRRLKTDRIDLLQLHMPDPETPFVETLTQLHALIEAGKVLEIGCSNLTAEQLHEAAACAPDGTTFKSLQNQYSLLCRDPETDVLPACSELDMGFLPFYPLANGLLTGKVRNGVVPEGTRLKEMELQADPFRAGHWLGAPMLERAERVLKVIDSSPWSPVEVAFAWLLANPTVRSVIAGASTPEQVRTNASTGSITLDAELLNLLDVASAIDADH
ncbi:MAG: aldo/keto reductase [Actinomycetota bacterium]